MKELFRLIRLSVVILMISGCEHGFADDTDELAPVSSILSAALDPAANCVIEEVHEHDGVYYGCHYNYDGHGHEGLQADSTCGLPNCGETGLHEHNEVCYAGHAGDDGCNHHGSNRHGNRHE